MTPCNISLSLSLSCQVIMYCSPDDITGIKEPIACLPMAQVIQLKPIIAARSLGCRGGRGEDSSCFSLTTFSPVFHFKPSVTLTKTTSIYCNSITTIVTITYCYYCSCYERKCQVPHYSYSNYTTTTTITNYYDKKYYYLYFSNYKNTATKATITTTVLSEGQFYLVSMFI